ncbi:gephyrin-like molybdotransferase Glp [Zavarzinia sp.]|uniref:molybdopterin molybdotransferase MoeA n=1 Tax=Zavarzinia sp. TaxID=2027920 RepID=UPI003565406E
MIPVEDARARIVAALEPVGTEVVPLAEALGRVLAAPVAARRTQPPLDLSAMDGWAVRAADLSIVPVALDIVGESVPGKGFSGLLGRGQAVRIFTGAPVPDGADAIAIQENTSHDHDRVTVLESAAPGRYIRLAGLDFRRDEIVMEAPRRLSVRDVALLAAADVAMVEVRRKPRIAVLATGDELTAPGSERGPAQIVDAARPALLAFIERAGGIPVDLGIARDNPDEIAEKAACGIEEDLLVTLGGASVSDRDLIARVLADGGGGLDFWKIAMRPGKPLMFGRHCGVPLLGLPGNPVSALVCALLFLGPALDRLSGLEPRPLAPIDVRLGADVAANDRREDYLRARLAPGTDGVPVATPAPQQDSSQLRILAEADVLIVRPPGAPALAAGALVPAIPLDWF